MQKIHPATHTVSSAKETLYTVACAFGDADAAVIAHASGMAGDSALFTGQQLHIP
jgi:hypothetical protein